MHNAFATLFENPKHPSPK